MTKLTHRATDSNLEQIIIENIGPQLAGNIKLMDLQGSKDFIISLIQQSIPTLRIMSEDDVEITKMDCVHEMFPIVLKHLQTKEPIFLTGPAGSGKTQIAEHCAEALSMPFGSISVCAQTTKTDFLGYYDANGRYTGTQFRTIYEKGGVFLIDEIDAGNPNVLAVLNAALSGHQFAFPDQIVKKHPDFLLISTANTLGKGSMEYVGRNQLDAATLDRFNFIHVNYDQKIESLLTGEAYAKELAYIWKIRAFVLEKELKVVVSTRSIAKIVKLLKLKVSIAEALSSTIFKTVSEENLKNILSAIGSVK